LITAGAIAAPLSGAMAAQPPNPRKKTASTATPANTAPRALSFGTGIGWLGLSMISSDIVGIGGGGFYL